MLGSICKGSALESQTWHDLLSLPVPAAVEVAGMSIP